MLDCPCGTRVTGASEDEIVEVSFAHLRERHPEMEEVPDASTSSSWRGARRPKVTSPRGARPSSDIPDQPRSGRAT